MKIVNTVENRILQIQERKRTIINGALGVEGLKTMGRRRLTMRDIMGLFTDVARHVAQRAEDAEDGRTANMAQQMLNVTRGIVQFGEGLV